MNRLPLSGGARPIRGGGWWAGVGGGGDLVLTMLGCVSKSEGHGSYYGFKLGSEMSENSSLKMSARFAVLLNNEYDSYE